MKSKTKLKLLFFLCAIICLILSIILIRITYARYITSLTATSSVELGSWLILINDQNIIENSDISDVVIPILDGNSTQYISEGTIAPTSSGYVEITMDYTDVNVPFKYELTFEHDADTLLEDLKLTGYAINNVDAADFTEGTVITSTISPEETDRTETLKLNFSWFDGEGEVLDDVEDTVYSRNVDNLGIRFKVTFTQLQPTA